MSMPPSVIPQCYAFSLPLGSTRPVLVRMPYRAAHRRSIFTRPILKLMTTPHHQGYFPALITRLHPRAAIDAARVLLKSP